MRRSIAALMTGIAAASLALVTLGSVHAAQASDIHPDINTVHCGSRTDFWEIITTDGTTTCYANNGSIDYYPYYEAVHTISTGNNHGYIWYYRDCNPITGQGRGPVVDVYVGDNSYVHYKCMTGFKITGR
jgi:hypothetical protein